MHTRYPCAYMCEWQKMEPSHLQAYVHRVGYKNDGHMKMYNIKDLYTFGHIMNLVAMNSIVTPLPCMH